MIEQFMYFMLGVFSAGLFALLLAPAFWRRALRLSRRRLELLMPLSMDEVAAERDLLRAEFAAERRRLEQRMETQAAAEAEKLAELGRRAAEIVDLRDELAALRGAHADLNFRHDVATRELAEANGERGALIVELGDATGLFQDMRARHDELKAAHRALESIAEERRTAIAALETQQEALGARIDTLTHDVETHARVARNETDRAQGLLEERDMLLKELRGAEQMTQATQARFEDERARVARLRTEIDALRAEVEEARQAQREAARARDSAERARDHAQAEAQAQADRLAALRGETRAVEASYADRAESLRAEIARLTGALAAAREARAIHGDIASEDARQLREAIAEIGAKVARMVGEEPPRKAGLM